MKNLILILSMMGILSSVNAQSPLLWSEDFSTLNNTLYADNPVIHTVGDTIRIICRKNTANGQELLIINYNLDGDTISTTTFGHDLVSNNYIVDYKFDRKNHVYILNNENVETNKTKVVIQKYSLDGKLIWSEQISNPADTSYSAHSISFANDSSMFVTVYELYNYTNSRFLLNLYAYNIDGTQLWKRDFDPKTELSFFSSNPVTYNNEIFLFGSSAKLVKVDINNNLVFNDSVDIVDKIYEVQLTPDNNLLFSGGREYRVSKTDLNGSLIWRDEFGTNLPRNVFGDKIFTTIQDDSGNIYVTGRHYRAGFILFEDENADVLTLKYDSNGSLVWQSRFKNGGEWKAGNTITLKDGFVYVGGQDMIPNTAYETAYLVLKIDDKSGQNINFYKNNHNDGDEIVTSLAVFDNGSVALTGLNFTGSKYDLKTQFLSEVATSVESIRLENSFKIFPNPAYNTLYLQYNAFEQQSRVRIFDLNGKLVLTNEIKDEITPIDITELNNGVFLIHIVDSKGQKSGNTEKFVKIE